MKKIVLIFACAILLLLSYLRAFERFELLTYDLRFKIRPPIKYSQDVAIIEIDNETLRLLGRWPFDRSYHAVLIDVLNSAGAKFIVFDLLFAEESSSDEKLIAASQIYGNVYFPLVFRLPEKNNCGQVTQIDTPLLESLKSVSKGWGHINVVTDIDGKRRRIPVVLQYQGKIIPQLSFCVARDYLGLTQTDIRFVPGKFVKFANHRIPLDDQCCTLVNYAGTWTKAFKHYSYFDIIKSYSQIQNHEKPQINLVELKDKVCFVGLTATATTDLNPIPLDPLYPMVGLHANFFNSIVNNSFIYRLGRGSNVLILIILSLISAALIIRRKPRISLVITTGIIIGYILIATLIFITSGVWIDVFYPVLVLLSLYVGITFYKFLVEQRTRLLIDKEFSIAQNIQRSFLPEVFPKKSGVEIAAELKTTKAVGGDLYDFVDFSGVNTDLIGVFIGDVSGKGMPAALYMALAIAQLGISSKDNTSTSKTLFDLNERLLKQSRSGLFITAFYMIYDVKQRKLIYSNGGHLPALIYRAKEERIDTLTTEEGGLLGLIEGINFGQNEIMLSEGDVIVLYTDGVIEARDVNKSEFGFDKLKKILVKNKSLTAQKIIESIKNELASFIGKAPQHDDFTILVFKIV